MKITELITNDRTPGDYIYHATRFDNLKEGLMSIKEHGLMKAKEALYGPGVYMGYNSAECLCQVSCKESRVLEARWQSYRLEVDPPHSANMLTVINYKMLQKA